MRLLSFEKKSLFSSHFEIVEISAIRVVYILEFNVFLNFFFIAFKIHFRTHFVEEIFYTNINPLRHTNVKNQIF